MPPTWPVCNGNSYVNDSKTQFPSPSPERLRENLRLSFQNSLDSVGSSLHYLVAKYRLCFLPGILERMAYLSGSGHPVNGQEKSVICTVSSKRTLYAWDVQEVRNPNWGAQVMHTCVHPVTQVKHVLGEGILGMSNRNKASNQVF